MSVDKMSEMCSIRTFVLDQSHVAGRYLFDETVPRSSDGPLPRRAAVPPNLALANCPQYCKQLFLNRELTPEINISK